MKKIMPEVAHYKAAGVVLLLIGTVAFLSSRGGRSGGTGHCVSNQKLFSEAQTYLGLSTQASDMTAALSNAHFAAAYMRLVDQTALRSTHNVTDAAQQIQTRVKVLESGSSAAAERSKLLP